METIQNIFVDSLNGFSLSQIPLFLFQLLCAGLGGLVLQFILNKKIGENTVKYGALIAMSVAVLTSIAKYSLPVSVISAAAILLLFRGKENSKIETVGQLLLVLIGIGCGSGSVVPTILGCILVFATILFTPLKK